MLEQAAGALCLSYTHPILVLRLLKPITCGLWHEHSLHLRVHAPQIVFALMSGNLMIVIRSKWGWNSYKCEYDPDRKLNARMPEESSEIGSGELFDYSTAVLQCSVSY